MKKQFIDTNIVIDLLPRKEPYYEEAAKLFSLADRKKIILFVSALTFANTNYVLSKLNNSILARGILTKFKVLVTVVDLNDKIIELSFMVIRLNARLLLFCLANLAFCMSLFF
jgi:predicted nucleic acid-binding protein